MQNAFIIILDLQYIRHTNPNCGRCFEDADKIYLLSIPKYQYRYRIIRRFIRRKLGIENGKKETLKSLINLIKWADKYSQNSLIEIKKILEVHSDKVIE